MKLTNCWNAFSYAIERGDTDCHVFIIGYTKVCKRSVGCIKCYRQFVE